MKRITEKNRLKKFRLPLKKNEMCAIQKGTNLEKRFLESQRKSDLK